MCAAFGGTQQPLLRNPPTWQRLDAAGETTNTTRTATNREKQSTHKFNEVRQRAYVLGAREREIFIDSTINTTNTRGELEEFLRILRDSIHEGSSLSFIATESLNLRKPTLDLIPSRKGIRILKGKSKRVCRSIGRSTAPSCARPCTPVDRPPPPVDREHFWPAPCAVSRSFVVWSLCYHLLYLLPPTILHLGEDFSNLSGSPTNSSLTPSEIDTRSRLERSRQNRHTISTKSTHDLVLKPLAQLSTRMHHMPSLHFTLGELSYMLITEHVSNLSNYMSSRRTHHESTLTLQLTGSLQSTVFS